MHPNYCTCSSNCGILITETEDFYEQKTIHRGRTTVTSSKPLYLQCHKYKNYSHKKIKEIFINACKDGKIPRKILEEHGFDLNILGKHRIWSIGTVNSLAQISSDILA